MRILVPMGIFFLVLALVFGASAWSQFKKSGRQWGPGAKTHRRIAVVFAIVGLGLLLLPTVLR